MFRKRSDRLNQLASKLEVGGFMRLKEAATLLGVSEMTVRRDLQASPDRFSYLGGYLTAGRNASGGMGYILDREREAHADAKRSACEAAARLIEPKQTIFIDCGTTMPHLASLVPVNQDITVVCYAINVADILCKKPGVRVIMLGGLYHASSASFSSPEALETLRNIGITTAFISAGGIHTSRGVSCSNFHEVEIKKLALDGAETNVLIIDSSKVGTVKPVVFAKADDFDIVCCDDAIEPEARQMLEDAALKVVCPGRESSDDRAAMRTGA